MDNFTITGMLQNIIDEMCEHYCRYTEEAIEAMEQNRECERCENCPLMKI